AHLSLPIAPDDRASARIEVEKLYARVFLPPHQLYVSQAQAEVYGVAISASGRVLNPEAYHPPSEPPGEPEKQRSDAIARIIAQVRTLRFERRAPQIKIRFSGDLADPSTLLVDASITAERVERAGYKLRSLAAAVTYHDRVCSLTKCVAADAQGRLEASGAYEFDTRTLHLAVHSTLDLQSMVHSLHLFPALDEFVFYDPLDLDVSGEIADGKLKMLGHVVAGRFDARSVPFQSFHADFATDNGKWFLHDLRLSNRTGELAGDAIQLPADFRGRLRSTINPGSLLSFASGKTAQMLSEWEFVQAPKVHLEIRGPSPQPEQCELAGDIILGATRLRGVPLNSAKSKIRFKDNAVTYEDFTVVRDEGTGTGTFTYDFGKHEVRLANIHTTLKTGDVATWIDAGLVHDLAPYRFKNPPALALNGVVQFDGGKNTKLDIAVDAPGGMDYTFLKKNLSFTRLSGQLLFTDQHLRISDLDGALFSGRVRGNADISLSKKTPDFKAKIEMNDVDFPSLTKLYFNYDSSHGSVRGHYDFSGRGSDARTMRGAGEISVINGDVFAIPWLGPFSGILNDIAPGMGYNMARKASSTFSIHDGVIETGDFLVEGQGFDMIGAGKLFFLDDKIDFTIRINAQGIPGLFLFPVSKLFEYVSDQSLSKPVWRPRRLPRM
ncbi:MAG: AsmA-like C-terminal region-containing protein, partial [Verrucomicrobiota bacterium]|nr:AsmA-like C-terminal region-containing protein [Verrucomicrobiota bacterium]